ncbi:hypothetical protein [uncultured Roseobacter sp.]|uniref:hypothetical protein n=1 Tax=uncultured Roseobacter sp. TaxID=114847 RepID=UPI0026225C22|nr:hypothetical protein [uncultured Roseobacter sp.]
MTGKSGVVICFAAAFGLSACVSPEVVASKSVTDQDLTCGQIREQLSDLDKIRAEAEKGRTFSGENVAAGILFWPAVIGNMSNANKALEAANERQSVLVDLSTQKRCG